MADYNIHLHLLDELVRKSSRPNLIGIVHAFENARDEERATAINKRIEQIFEELLHENRKD